MEQAERPAGVRAELREVDAAVSALAARVWALSWATKGVLAAWAVATVAVIDLVLMAAARLGLPALSPFCW